MKVLFMIYVKKVFLISLSYSQTNLSPSQIDNIIKDSGMSRDQVKDILNNNRGLMDNISPNLFNSENEVIDQNANQDKTNIKQKLNEINSFDKSINDINENDEIGFESDKFENSIADEDNLENGDDDNADEDLNNSPIVEQDEVPLKFFGYDIFRNDPSNFQMSSSVFLTLLIL